MPRSEEQFAETLLAVILAALCLEAFANEWGENILESGELDDFLGCRRKYKKPHGQGSVAWKIRVVFEKKWGAFFPDDSCDSSPHPFSPMTATPSPG